MSPRILFTIAVDAPFPPLFWFVLFVRASLQRVLLLHQAVIKILPLSCLIDAIVQIVAVWWFVLLPWSQQQTRTQRLNLLGLLRSQILQILCARALVLSHPAAQFQQGVALFPQQLRMTAEAAQLVVVH
jgi:hypothetical protein